MKNPTPPSSSAFDRLFNDKRVLICCGSGGVGKTTTAAALALSAAMRGYKTLVLTIDPARRLANSLGIEKIDYLEKQIPKAELKKAGIETKAPLFAMMLDPKHTFDALIVKHATSPEKANAILDNKLYRQLSSMIGGSQEYMAMEKLHEITQDRDYDLIVLDTPPSRHALDFLDAPARMSAMIGDSMMKWFLKPSLFVGRASLKILERPMHQVFKTFDKIMGFEFLQDLSEMLMSFSDLLEGFQQRAEKVQALLQDPKTSFLLISSPQSIPLQEAAYFYSKIVEKSLPFSGFIFNRVQRVPDGTDTLPASLPSTAREEYQELRKLFKNLQKRDQSEIEKFKDEIDSSEGLILKAVPRMDRDIHDLAGLRDLGEELFR